MTDPPVTDAATGTRSTGPRPDDPANPPSPGQVDNPAPGRPCGPGFPGLREDAGSRPSSGTTSTAPSARRVRTRFRGLLIGLLLLFVVAVVAVVLRSDSEYGALDPRSADPGGSRAVAELLATHGVTTRVVTTLDEAAGAARADTTLLVAVPDLLTATQQARLRAATALSGGRLVLVAPGAPSVGTLAPGVSMDTTRSRRQSLAPRCTLAEARRAGDADTGGRRYSTTAHHADACYPANGLPTLLRLPASARNATGDIVVLGSSHILVNDHLARRGNASLALQLLGSRPHLVWYLPSLTDPSATSEGRSSDFLDLIPGGWLWGTVQLFVAAALAALWRARRLGPLVSERLPVAIRASETTEGRARLYRRTGARDRAADALRSATRSRLAPLVGLPLAQAHTPEALLPALDARLGDDAPRTTGPEPPSPQELLFGPPPHDDAALVRLADRLDALESEVRRP